MRITVRQLKTLIKETVKETLEHNKNFMPKPSDAPDAWGVAQGKYGGYANKAELYRVAYRGGDNLRPDGGEQYPDGRIKWPGGEMQYPDGMIEFPDGRLRMPDGTVSRAQDEDSDLNQEETWSDPDEPVKKGGEPYVGIRGYGGGVHGRRRFG